MLTPSQKGAVAEAAVTTAAIELGLTVLRPLCEGRRYDIVIAINRLRSGSTVGAAGVGRLWAC
jgi:hypothetical protein